MLSRRCGLSSRGNRQINIVWGEGGKMCLRCSKIDFIAKCLNTFVAHYKRLANTASYNWQFTEGILFRQANRIWHIREYMTYLSRIEHLRS